MKYAITELKTLIKCRGCKYIIPLYFAFQTPENLYMALEYIPTGDLSKPFPMQASISEILALSNPNKHSSSSLSLSLP
jgi:serine/threonine protein kinase